MHNAYVLHNREYHERSQLFAFKYRTVLPGEVELAAELERRHVLDGTMIGGSDE